MRCGVILTRVPAADRLAVMLRRRTAQGDGMDRPFVITLDGPAGVGKSTLAKRLAAELGIAYLDTGAMYRTLGLALGADAADLPEEELRRRCSSFVFSLERGEGEAWLLCCGGKPVGGEIRTERAGRLASIVARLPVLRSELQKAQQSLGRGFSLVAEGRDMGTKVFPGALRKFFLDARPEVRAERRLKELLARGESADFETVLNDIRARDEQDRGRAVDPLRPAPDAVLVDTSDLDLDGVLRVLLNSVHAAFGRDGLHSSSDAGFTHLAEDGSLRMVDVGDKLETRRVARARAVVEMSASTLDLLRRDALPKGDVLAVAKVAGIMAAKRTWELIPLCHPLNVNHVDIRFDIRDEPPSVVLESEVRVSGRTGVEMEAIMAAQVAAATIYDMAKAVQKDMIIRDVRLIYKSGGKSGDFRAE